MNPITALKTECKRTDRVENNQFVFETRSLTIGGSTLEVRFVGIPSSADSQTKDDAKAYSVTWMLDDQSPSCVKCETDFSLFRRRHHCRVCGLLVCHDCSDKTLVIETLEETPSRVCQDCFQSVSVATNKTTVDAPPSEEKTQAEENTEITASSADEAPVAATQESKPEPEAKSPIDEPQVFEESTEVVEPTINGEEVVAVEEHTALKEEAVVTEEEVSAVEQAPAAEEEVVMQSTEIPSEEATVPEVTEVAEPIAVKVEEMKEANAAVSPDAVPDVDEQVPSEEAVETVAPQEGDEDEKADESKSGKGQGKGKKKKNNRGKK